MTTTGSGLFSSVFGSGNTWTDTIDSYVGMPLPSDTIGGSSQGGAWDKIKNGLGNIDVAQIGLYAQAAGLFSGLFAERKQRKAYEEYQKLQAQATLTNYLYQTKALNNRYAEEKEASAVQQQQIYLQNLQAKATAQASAASAGVEGISIENLFKGYDRATAMSKYTAEKNLRMRGLQYDDEMDSLRINAINSINLQQPYTSNFGATLLGGLGQIMSNYSAYKKDKEQTEFYRNRKGL